MKEKTLKTFCLRLILFALLLFIVDQTVGWVFVKIKDVGLAKNPESMWMKTPFVVEKVDADVLIIGSSKASHHYNSKILSDSLHMTVYNCGQDGCFFNYQNTLINMALDRYKPKIIIWDIQPGQFVDNANPNEYQNMRYLSPYYSNHWAKDYLNSQGLRTSIDLKSKMYSYNSKAIQYIFPLVVKGMQSNNGYLPLPSKGYEYPKKSKIINDTSTYLRPDNWFILMNNTIERCKKNGVKLILLVSPEYTYKSKAYITAASDLEKDAQLEGVMFKDYSSSSAYMRNAHLFKDASHLNASGADIFTKTIVGLVR